MGAWLRRLLGRRLVKGGATGATMEKFLSRFQVNNPHDNLHMDVKNRRGIPVTPFLLLVSHTGRRRTSLVPWTTRYADIGNEARGEQQNKFKCL